jgi:hypothetical protein
MTQEGYYSLFAVNRVGYCFISDRNSSLENETALLKRRGLRNYSLSNSLSPLEHQLTTGVAFVTEPLLTPIVKFIGVSESA